MKKKSATTSKLKKIFGAFFLVFALTQLTSCKKEGCTDPDATNFNSEANEDDGSCNYIVGCTDPLASNFNPNATRDNGTCNYVFGCTDPSAKNYDPSATRDDGSCEYEGYVMFWTDCNICSALNVYIENVYQGQVTGWYNSEPAAPNCTALNCLTRALQPGTYGYSGEESVSGVSVSGSLTITANKCLTVKL